MNGIQRLAVVTSLASLGSLATLGWAKVESTNAEQEYQRALAIPAPNADIPGIVGQTMRNVHVEIVLDAAEAATRKTTFYLNMQKWVLRSHLLAAAMLVIGWVAMGFRSKPATADLPDR